MEKGTAVKKGPPQAGASAAAERARLDGKLSTLANDAYGAAALAYCLAKGAQANKSRRDDVSFVHVAATTDAAVQKIVLDAGAVVRDVRRLNAGAEDEADASIENVLADLAAKIEGAGERSALFLEAVRDGCTADYPGIGAYPASAMELYRDCNALAEAFDELSLLL